MLSESRACRSGRARSRARAHDRVRERLLRPAARRPRALSAGRRRPKPIGSSSRSTTIGRSRRSKGAGRPILPAADRAELVGALRGVDYVVVFGDPTVERLLTLLEPDVHCKGTDYTVETVPERAVVLAYGGRTAIVGDPKHHATRDLLARIARTSNVERAHAGTQHVER